MRPASSPPVRATSPVIRSSWPRSRRRTSPPEPSSPTGADRAPAAPGPLPSSGPGTGREKGGVMKALFARYGAPLLMILPSVILIGIFVYGLLGVNFWTSMTDNHSAAQAADQEPIAF